MLPYLGRDVDCRHVAIEPGVEQSSYMIPMHVLVKQGKTRGCLLVLCLLVAARLVVAQASGAQKAEPFDYFQNSWQVIGLKDYPNGTRITPENELQLANNNVVRFSVGARSVALSRQQTKTLLDGWMPVVVLSAVQDEVRYDFTLWATPLPTVKDWRSAFDWPTEGDNFLNWIRVRATNIGSKRAEAMVAADLFVKTNFSSQLFRWSAQLAPGKSSEVTWRLPFAPLKKAAAFDDQSGAVWLERTAQYWRGLLARGARFEVPDQKVNQAIRAAHVCQFLCNDRGVMHGGEGFYDEFYIRDGAYQLLEYEEFGFADVARKAVESYLQVQRPDGRFETQKGQFDANGQAVWVLWQYWKMYRDVEWLRRVYPQIRRAMEWTKQARRQVPPDAKFAGLLPNALADGEFLWDGRYHIVGYDFWNLRGLLCAADVARELGEYADVSEFEREAADYRQAIDATCDRAGLNYFPPSWEKAGTHWGNTEVLWPTQLFAPDDSRVSGLLREVRERHGGGFREGTIRWTGTVGKGEPAIHPYLSAYTTMSSLVRGEHEKFAEEFYWYLLHSSASHAFPEGIFYERRFAWVDTIPHATGASNFAFLLRHALLHEQGNDLHLLSGAPDWWLEAGREIRLENAPTHFGPMSLWIRGRKNGVEIKVLPPHRSPAARILLHLPKSRPLLARAENISVAVRDDQSRRWDFPSVLELYHSHAAPTLK